MNVTATYTRHLAAAAMLVLGSAVAEASVLNLSTGLDASDTLITLGNTPDAHWTVDQPAGGIAPAKVVDATNTGGAFFAWAGAVHSSPGPPTDLGRPGLPSILTASAMDQGPRSPITAHSRSLPQRSRRPRSLVSGESTTRVI